MKKFLFVLLATVSLISCEDTQTNEVALQAKVDDRLYTSTDPRGLRPLQPGQARAHAARRGLALLFDSPVYAGRAGEAWVGCGIVAAVMDGAVGVLGFAGLNPTYACCRRYRAQGWTVLNRGCARRPTCWSEIRVTAKE